MSCTDYARHERLLECTHSEPAGLAIKLADGCSARLCQTCDTRLGVKRWPDLVERIAGPTGGLDTLELLRALNRADNR